MKKETIAISRELLALLQFDAPGAGKQGSDFGLSRVDRAVPAVRGEVTRARAREEMAALLRMPRLLACVLVLLWPAAAWPRS